VNRLANRYNRHQVTVSWCVIPLMPVVKLFSLVPMGGSGITSSSWIGRS